MVMSVRVRMFVILRDVLELLVAEFAVEWSQYSRYLSLHLSLLCDGSLMESKKLYATTLKIHVVEAYLSVLALFRSLKLHSL